MKRIFHLFLPVPLMLLLPLLSVAQQLKLGNNPSTINKAAVLELESKIQGLLLTRITDTTVAPLTTAQDGTILFYKGDNSLRVRSGGAWRKTLFSVDTTDIVNFSVKVRSLFSGTAPITYSNGVIGISQASGTTNGYLSSTDWTTFNNKLATVDTTNIANFSVKVRSLFSGTAPITYNNGVIGISQASGTTNGYLSSTDWTTFNNKLATVDTTNIANFSVKMRSLFSGTAPITYNNGVIGISQASGTTNGYLSSTDWTTFNNKLATVDTTNIANFSVKVRSLFSGTAPITYSNGVIGISQASGATNGYLSSADWTTFNNKLATVDTTNIANFSVKVRSLFSGTAPITYSNGVIGISKASGATNGYLSSADWTTFNNKLSTVDTTNIASFSVKVRSLFSGTAPITYSNGVIGISQASGITNGYLSSTDWTTFNNKLSTVDTTNIASFSVKVRSLFSGTAPITYSNGVIGISQASGITNGYLSSTDWTTFNNKLSTVDTTNIANFSVKVRSLFSGTAPITYSNGVIGISKSSGIANGYLSSADWTTFNNKLSTVDTTNIANFYVKVRSLLNAGSGIAYNSVTGTISFSGSVGGWLLGGNGVIAVQSMGTTTNFDLPFITNNTERMRISNTGNVGIANASPQAKLDVGGNFKLGASGTVVSSMIKSNFSLSDNSNINSQSDLVKTATVTGANVNASVIVNPRTALPQGLAIAYTFVSATNTITIDFLNGGADDQRLGSVTFDVTIINP
ncbi:hypothetical protein CLV51_10912 [Chitinophaga niastensis]|uniref:Uncharacterized protein n=1 Tax=Chitinophaga niastensis TaxID=536980 RepID=A0A2P8H9X1_CHINA|nr:hypothetical protein [Chitinophaga niastensis]PSL43018.1 hypothetical protein CLV51_10912 [Chitinophaga niastensis]